MHERAEPYPILGFVADLISETKIESAASPLGYQLSWIERKEQVAPSDPDTPARQLAEHLVGPGAVLIERLTELKPALIIFDLGNQHIPWAEWIALIKSAPATRRLPVICFGSHVATAQIEKARSAGADAVFARSRFFSDLPNLIKQYAHIIDLAALEETCDLPLSQLAIEGIELFNRGEYFEAHELLEAAWNEDPTPGKELYRAILQVAVAYLQIERGNYKGAVKMFLRLRQWIDPFPDVCRGVDVQQLRQDAVRVRQRLLDLGPGRIHEFDRLQFHPVVYHLQP